jgi:hypothetical protein
MLAGATVKELKPNGIGIGRWATPGRPAAFVIWHMDYKPDMTNDHG